MSTRVRFTRADLEQLPPDPADRRQEVVDGQLVASPSPSLRHARTVLRVVNALQAWTLVHGGEVVSGNYDLVIAEDQSLVPDVLFVLDEHVGRLEERHMRQPPDLVVEVSARESRDRDLGAKRRAYGRFGVPEYWVVDLDADAALAFRPAAAGRYAEPRRFERGATLTTPLLPGLAAPVVDLLAP